MTREKRDKGFLAIWPLATVLSLAVPMGWVICVALFVLAVVLVMRDSSLSGGTKISLIALWVFASVCLIYALLAFGSMVEAADNMSPDPSWTQGLLPILLVGIIAFISSALIILKGGYSRKRI